jgi:hypothetical protein
VLVNYHFVNTHKFAAEYAKADLAHYGWVPQNLTRPPPPSNETRNTWPTLGEMIDGGGRLVKFINELHIEGEERVPYLLREFDFVWENAYNVGTPAGFACTPDRPETMNKTPIAKARATGMLFFMNHLRYEHQAFGIILPDVGNVEDTNSWYGQSGLGAHLKKCTREVGRPPTYVLVDYLNVGDAIEAVDIVNRVVNPIGRRTVSKEGLGLKRTSGSRQEVPVFCGALVLAFGATMFLF